MSESAESGMSGGSETEERPDAVSENEQNVATEDDEDAEDDEEGQEEEAGPAKKRRIRKPWVELRKWDLREFPDEQQVEAEIDPVLREELKCDITGLKDSGRSRCGWNLKNSCKSRYNSTSTVWYKCPPPLQVPLRSLHVYDGYIIMLKIQERHTDQSHQEDGSKFLKTEQIVAFC